MQALTVVLGIGGPVARAAAATHPRYVTGRPGLDLGNVERAVAQAGGGDVLLLGSAASAVEMVYCLEADPRLRTAFRRIVAISPGGRLPDGVGSGCGTPFVAAALEAGPDTAEALLGDLASDVQAARDLGLRMPDVYPVLHGGFTTRFRRMCDTEKKKLTDVYVPVYLSLMRRTSTVYGGGADRLLAHGQLVQVTGRARDVRVGVDEVEVELQDGRVFRGAVALDCRGFGRAADDPLLSRLIARGVVGPNDSNMGGIRVNARLEAAPGVLVLGPLLAGTPRVGDHIWHLEDIPRIHEVAADVVDTLDQVLSAHREVAELVDTAPVDIAPPVQERRTAVAVPAVTALHS